MRGRPTNPAEVNATAADAELKADSEDCALFIACGIIQRAPSAHSLRLCQGKESVHVRGRATKANKKNDQR